MPPHWACCSRRVHGWNCSPRSQSFSWTNGSRLWIFLWTSRNWWLYLALDRVTGIGRQSHRTHHCRLVWIRASVKFHKCECDVTLHHPLNQHCNLLTPAVCISLDPPGLPHPPTQALHHLSSNPCHSYTLCHWCWSHLHSLPHSGQGTLYLVDWKGYSPKSVPGYFIPDLDLIQDYCHWVSSHLVHLVMAFRD